MNIFLTPAELNRECVKVFKEIIAAMRCENCGNSKLDISGTSTADMSSAWQDADGTWYKGPSEVSKQFFCSHCKWAAHEVWTRGKLTSRVTIAGSHVENDAKA